MSNLVTILRCLWSFFFFFFVVSMVKTRIRTESVLIARRKDVLLPMEKYQYPVRLRMPGAEMKNQTVFLSE